MNREHAELLRLPWSVAPLKGKYYGTKIIDAYGDEVMSLSRSGFDGDPTLSERETPRNDINDSHYESQQALDAARLIVELVNRGAHPAPEPED